MKCDVNTTVKFSLKQKLKILFSHKPINLVFKEAEITFNGAKFQCQEEVNED